MNVVLVTMGTDGVSRATFLVQWRWPAKLLPACLEPSISVWTERRPDGSFFTLMMVPWDWTLGVEDGQRLQVDARGLQGRMHRGTSKRVSRWLR